MRRVVLLLFVGAAALVAQTEIRDMGYTGIGGSMFTGKLLVTAPDMTTADDRTVLRWQQEFTITDGVVSVDLEPNDSAQPSGTSYLVRFTPTKGTAWTERWIVPTSDTPRKVHQVRVQTVPVPSMLVQPTQIAGGGATPGQCLAWTGTAWQPRPLAYGTTFTEQTAITIPGSVHGLNTDDVLVKCYDDSTPRKLVEPDSISVDQTTFEVTIVFAVPQSGKCVVGR